ncbi:DNA-processing protein DprA [Catellatospora vulcania]|uniref:DNA-processing protein DprA n=1 Tax=Catellatospora vulcania TaxID=1460450 RepID=UPI0012D44277|nr:DNA-processing protein DprA [Catellatospora vulcania]
MNIVDIPTDSADEQSVGDARLVLGSLVEPGSRRLHELVAAYGPVEALDRLAAGHESGPLAEAAALRLHGRAPAEFAARLRERADRLGVRVVTPESGEWPSRLAELRHISVDGPNPVDRDTYPPQCLWLRGPHRLDDAVERSVSMVGARANTLYGQYAATELGYGLADRGWTVVSGGAYGIDAIAHRAALSAGGLTVAVLACGVDRPYPLSNTALFDQIAEEGLLISEWPPGTAPFKLRFLVRNRVIAALSRGTLLVEAAARSGARQTLRRARQLRRAAMAVPGPITSQASVGCHEELRREPHEPVRLIATVEQVLEEVGGIGELAPVPRGASRPTDALEPVEQQLVDAVPRRGGAYAEQIAADAGVSLRAALAVLPSLALRGHLREHGGGYARPLPARHKP